MLELWFGGFHSFCSFNQINLYNKFITEWTKISKQILCTTDVRLRKTVYYFIIIYGRYLELIACNVLTRYD